MSSIKLFEEKHTCAVRNKDGAIFYMLEMRRHNPE